MSFEDDIESIGLCKNDFIDIASNFELMFEQAGNTDRVYIDLPEIIPFESFLEYIIKDFLKHRGYESADYIHGICWKDGRKYKIGKILTKLSEKKYLAQFESDPGRITLNNSYSKMVISRRPEDILYMSTNRRWTSCANINFTHKGDENTQLQRYIQDDGGVVVYGISANDLEIKKPYFRKWFQNDGHIANNSQYYGLYHLSTTIFIDNYISDYLDKILPFRTLSEINKSKSYHFDKLKSLLYNSCIGIHYNLSMELGVLNELLFDEVDLVDYNVLYENSLDIINELDFIFKTPSFRRRIFLIVKLLFKYASMNKTYSTVSIYYIKNLVNSRIMYHYVGSNVMDMKKAYDKRNKPWWVESEERRYKSNKQLEDEKFIAELMSDAS